MIEHIISEEENEVRADRVVKSICSNVSYALLQKLFRKHNIKLNGKKIQPSDRVHTGDKLVIFAHLDQNTEAPHSGVNQRHLEQLKQMILFENDDFLAINKPAGLAVQMGTKVSICVETFLQSYTDAKCMLVHRLDKDTSGVLLIAKGVVSARNLTKLFRENKIKKTYLAIVDGKIKSSGCIDNYLTAGEQKVHISQDGQRAITQYKPIQRVGYNTLLELKPLTGRKHQLRVHCADALLAPILGDRKYNPHPQHNDLFLHAYEIHVDGICIQAPLPQHFSLMIDSSSQ